MSCTLDGTAILPAGFCVTELPVSVDQARSLVVHEGSILVVERGTSSVLRIDPEAFSVERLVQVTSESLTHSLVVQNGFLYASSATKVYRWSLDNPGVAPTVIVDNMSADGRGGAPFGHQSRTLLIRDGFLYIAIGSVGNVDPDSFRSRIRRFALNATTPQNFVDGFVYADGVRNEVGLALDRHGVLWGVENSADRLTRDDLGGFITDDNPAEELNRFDEPGAHYGYPYCWTEFRLDESLGLGLGTVWTWPSFMDTVSDEQCRSDYRAPALSMQAHSAPLGITFYEYNAERPSSCPAGSGFPESMDGYAFIAFHGSWNRQEPTGYKVVYVPMDEVGEVAAEQPIDLLAHVPPNAKWESGLRPVDVAFDECGRLYVSSDGTRTSNGYIGSTILRIDYLEETTAGTPVPTPVPSAAAPFPVNPTSVVSSSATCLSTVFSLISAFLMYNHL